MSKLGFTVACLTGLLVVSVCRSASSEEAERARKATKPTPAEDAGWKLAFSDDFDRNELGEHWVVVDGKWTVENGCLRGSGTLMSAQGFPRTFREDVHHGT